MVKTRNPAGAWSTPLLLKPAKGWIDPCPFWDDDGNAYLVHAWANSRSGIKSILTINRMSADGTRLLDDGKTVFDGHARHPTIEGPKLYKRNGYYYIFAPAGGVTEGWQTVLRAKEIYGSYDDRIVMDRGKSSVNGPHQGGWVELKSGESWFVHFQDRGAYGRIVHLQPMKWIDDWPVIGVDTDGDGRGEPVLSFRKPDVGRVYPRSSPQTSDEFAASKLGLQWQWQANFRDEWLSLSRRRGWLSLSSMPLPAEARNLWLVPNLLLQKLPAREFTVTARMNAANLREGERSGLVVMGRDYAYIAVARTANGLRLVRVTCLDALKNKEEENASTEIRSPSVYIRVSVTGDAMCEFSFSRDGKKWESLGQEFKAKPGVWIGAKVGLFALSSSEASTRGHADYDWFRIAPLSRSAQTHAHVR